MKRKLWVGILVGYLLLRWVLLLHPGYVYDTNAYKRWALRAAQGGLSQVYATSDMDYPPLYAWILYPLGKIYEGLDPQAAGAMRDSRLLTFLIKLPPLVFDFGIAFLLFRLGRRVVSARRKPGPSWEAILPAAYLLNPAVVFDTGWWGQPDSVHSFFVLGAFLVLGDPELFRGRAVPGPAGERSRGRAWPAWVLLTLGTLMKPLGAPYFPLLLVLSLRWRGPTATLRGLLAAAITAAAVLSPFLLYGDIGAVLRRIAGDVSLMPFTSANGHNLWWLLGPWRPSNQPWIGPITADQVGLALFGLLLLGLLWKGRALERTRVGNLGPAQGLAFTLTVAVSFFMLSTHMHENHLFLALPLVLALLPFEPRGSRAWRHLALALTVGVLINLLLHDLVIPRYFPFTLGGPSPVVNHHLHRPFTWAQIVAIQAGALLNLGSFLFVLYATFRPGERNAVARLQHRTG